MGGDQKGRVAQVNGEMMCGNRKVLMIAYYFPPSGGPGVQRTLKFVKYLPQFGWKPIVLTAKGADYPAYDYTLLDEIPGDVPVYRAKIVEPYKLYRKLTGKTPGEAVDIAVLSGERASKLSERIAEWIRAAFFVPDARIGWLPFAISMGLKIIHRERPDVIYSSAPPYTCHLIGLALKKLTGLPWVADFRDSWVGWHSAPQWRPYSSRKLELTMERQVLRSANLILTVSKGVWEDLKTRHSEVRTPWRWLPNGYDGEDFDGIKFARRKNNKLTFTYTGSLFWNPKGLIEAFKQLAEEMPCLASKVHFRFVGRVAQHIADELKSYLNADIIPYVPHNESLRYLMETDIALLVVDNVTAGKGVITGKLFEYLGAHKPIFALTPDGEAAQIIRELGAGVTVPPKNVAAIKQALADVIQKWEQGQRLCKLYDPKDFERKFLTKQLAEIFRVFSRGTK